eukprot:TRINITY_DN6904_c0_g1_i6.p1 TRINITY_DN6904_c0_g1~~TRINITY_DN6904_c0_g1_i6.p1  ORF type:complete len:154 (-),score=28.10 TRINITY_DN6904_c0_g1_i6:500-961(-)
MRACLSDEKDDDSLPSIIPGGYNSQESSEEREPEPEPPPELFASFVLTEYESNTGDLIERIMRGEKILRVNGLRASFLHKRGSSSSSEEEKSPEPVFTDYFFTSLSSSEEEKEPELHMPVWYPEEPDSSYGEDREMVRNVDSVRRTKKVAQRT